MPMFLEMFVQVIVEKLLDKATEEIVNILHVKKEMLALQKNLENIRLVLFDAESKKIENESIHHWLAQLREQIYDANDLLDDCRQKAAKRTADAESKSRRRRANATLHKVPVISILLSAGFRRNVAGRIQRINSTLKTLNSDIPMLQLMTTQSVAEKKVCRYSRSRSTDTSPFMLDNEIVGFDDDAQTLVHQITRDSTRAHSVFSIIGIPGVGKTTLAKKVFNHSVIKNQFDITVWICVSKNSYGEDLLKRILRSNRNNNEDERNRGGDGNYADLTELTAEVIDRVKDKRVFMVLDDVWNSNVWEKYLKVPLNKGARSSRILITTRNDNVAKKMKSVYNHPMTSLSTIDGWSMLSKIVSEEEDGSDTNEFMEIGMEIVEKCRGLPLAIQLVGGVLRTTDKTKLAWEGVLSSRTWSVRDLPEDVKPSLLLSYEDLPPHLKHCFIYCSLFPEDFEFTSFNLEMMWIAEGFIKKVEGKEMEELAEDYFHDFVMRNLLQPAETCLPDRYIMHDMVRSLACYVSKNQYICEDSQNRGTIFVKYRHMSLVQKEIDTLPEKEITKHRSLRTLLLSENPMIKTISPGLLSKLSRLRILDLSDTGIETLPDSLGALVHLRYLDISYTKLKVLPDSIRYLRNLETLKADEMPCLLGLPDSIVELTNLKHLWVLTQHSLERMPIGIGNLKKVRVLKFFAVNEADHCMPNIRELGDLCELTELSICRLERVASREEAEQASLQNKKKLKRLVLSCWSVDDQPTDEEIEKLEKVFSGLRTPDNLEIVSVYGFFGKVFPNFISVGSFSRITFLRLLDCNFLKQFPPLGDMPNLEVLFICRAVSIVEIGSEFFGKLKFPKLTSLSLSVMYEFQVFMVEQGAFPCLQELDISECPKLRSLPEGLLHTTCLKRLYVHELEEIEFIENLSSISELSVGDSPSLRCISNLPALSSIGIHNCSALKSVEGIGELSHLFIEDEKMEALPRWLEDTSAPKCLKVVGSNDLVVKTYKNAEHWNLIEECLRAEVRSFDGSRYMTYNREPFHYISDMTDTNASTSQNLTN